MAHPQPVIRCALCQAENDPEATACRSCRESLLVSLAITRPVPQEPAHAIATLLAAGNRDLEERLEARLLRGRGVLMRELSLADASWCQEQAAQLGARLEIRRWHVVSSPQREQSPRPWRTRPVTGVIIVAMLGVAILFLHYVYRAVTMPPGDAGIRWQSATIIPGRIVPPDLPKPAAPRPPEPIRGDAAPAVVENARQAVVRISVTDNIGTGFFVDARGYVVTNYHVVAGAGTITVTTATRDRRQARLVRAAPAWDLALLKVEVPVPSVLDLADGARAAPGQHALIIGSAEGQDGSQRSGEVAGVGRVMDGISLLELDLAAARGNSGSPVLDAAGRVIGVVNAILADSSRTSYAILSNYLFDGPDALLRDIDRVYPVSDLFLDGQLRALADVGDHVLLERSRTTSQAFITGDGVLTAVVRLRSGDDKLDAHGIEVNFWVRKRGGDEVLSQFIQAGVSLPADEDSETSPAIFFRHALTPAEHREIVTAGEVWLEVQARSPRVQSFLELKRIDPPATTLPAH